MFEAEAGDVTVDALGVGKDAGERYAVTIVSIIRVLWLSTGAEC